MSKAALRIFTFGFAATIAVLAYTAGTIIAGRL